MLEALGYRFIDAEGNILKGEGRSLESIMTIDTSAAIPELKSAEFIVACDVDSPFHGPKGAAYVYAPQKGATPQMVELLDNGLKHFADIIKGTTGKDISEMPGAGAAGGLGGAFKAFLNAGLRKGSLAPESLAISAMLPSFTPQPGMMMILPADFSTSCASRGAPSRAVGMHPDVRMRAQPSSMMSSNALIGSDV